MTETEIIVKQKQILADALKTIGTNRRTPSWIVEVCKRAVTNAREVEKESSLAITNTPVVATPIEPGDIVRSNDPKDKCVYSVARLSTTIDSVKLWDLSVLKGDGRAQVGQIAHNVPETKFHK